MRKYNILAYTSYLNCSYIKIQEDKQIITKLY